MVHITAEELAARQREISVSEFFEKNKHLLGFDNPTKALLIVVKEAVDNSIDACTEAGILPELKVDVKQVDEEVYRITVEDNGPGLPAHAIAKTFGKFLYGSKFHRLCQARGQQGIGIKGSILYAQLTTAKPVNIWSKTKDQKKTVFTKLKIDVTKNEPVVLEQKYIEDRNSIKEHGIRIQLEVVGRYRKAKGIDDYLLQTAIANPFVKIIYTSPEGSKTVIERAVNELPKLPKEIKPHPYGVELGFFLRMLLTTKAKSVLTFLTNEFSSVGATTAKRACEKAKIKPGARPQDIDERSAEKLLKALQSLDIQRPSLDCLSPIGSDAFENGLKKMFPNAEFIAAHTREPSVYRGNPFQVEGAIVYDPESFKTQEQAKLMRFANRAPLLYQQSACALYKAATMLDWRRYGLQHSKGSLPVGPCLIAIHLCSVWVPFVSEGKEAIASYPIILKEIKLCLQQVARKLSIYLSGKRKMHMEKRRIEIFQRYAGEVSDALSKLAEVDKKRVEQSVMKLIETRGKRFSQEKENKD